MLPEHEHTLDTAAIHHRGTEAHNSYDIGTLVGWRLVRTVHVPVGQHLVEAHGRALPSAEFLGALQCLAYVFSGDMRDFPGLLEMESPYIVAFKKVPYGRRQPRWFLGRYRADKYIAKVLARECCRDALVIPRATRTDLTDF